MKLFTLLKYNRTLWEEIEWEFRDIWNTLCDFFIMIKEHTIDVLADKFGDGMTLMVIAIGAIGIMVVALGITNNRN